MGLDTTQRQKTDYFLGVEVEHTAMKGEQTLFVVGVKEVKDIVERALKHGVRHLYFGTSPVSYTHLTLPTTPYV